MKFKINNDVFVRHEKTLPDENVFIFIGKRNDMLTATSEVYDILELIRKNYTKEEIFEELCNKYSESTKAEISEGLDYTLKYLVDRGVIQ